MKRTFNQSEFVDEFRKFNRHNNFSYDGRIALFDYFEDYEESTGEEIELDVIAICYEWTEYGSAVECAEQYGETFDNEDDALEWLRDRTSVLVVENYNQFREPKAHYSVIIQDF